MNKWSIAAVICAALVMPTVARAQSVVYACVGNVSKAVRIVSATETCIAAPPSKAETAVQWNVQGPPGPPGINGTNGTPGSHGTNGTNGTSVTVSGSLLPGDSNCSNGGVSLLDGSTNTTFYICNGTDAKQADGLCLNGTNRYVNCQNGTVTDTVTELIWLQQADCLPNAPWAAAKLAALGLKDGDCGLSDGSSPGDWRLPTRDEWNALVAQGVAMGCGPPLAYGPAVTNDAGTTCYYYEPSSITGLALDGALIPNRTFWTSTVHETVATDAVAGSIEFGNVFFLVKSQELRVWPVRGRPR